MADKFSKKKRSEIMSKIRGEETIPEIAVRQFLFSKGFRFRKNIKSLSGKPDIVLPKYKTVIFVHECFWHGHKNCNAAKLPETRKAFWKNKIASNVERDKRNYKELKKSGWKVVTVWQCQIKNKNRKEKRLAKVIKEITG